MKINYKHIPGYRILKGLRGDHGILKGIFGGRRYLFKRETLRYCIFFADFQRIRKRAETGYLGRRRWCRILFSRR
jgi:hypothetical protein